MFQVKALNPQSPFAPITDVPVLAHPNTENANSKHVWGVTASRSLPREETQVGFHMKRYCRPLLSSDFKWHWRHITNFIKTPQYKIVWPFAQRFSSCLCRRTDIAKPTAALLQLPSERALKQQKYLSATNKLKTEAEPTAETCIGPIKYSSLYLRQYTVPNIGLLTGQWINHCRRPIKITSHFGSVN
jgi:hypothetical protein